MSELTVTINSTVAVAPQSPAPGELYAWDEFYGVPAITQPVVSSQIENPNPSPYPPLS